MIPKATGPSKRLFTNCPKKAFQSRYLWKLMLDAKEPKRLKFPPGKKRPQHRLKGTPLGAPRGVQQRVLDASTHGASTLKTLSVQQQRGQPNMDHVYRHPRRAPAGPYILLNRSTSLRHQTRLWSQRKPAREKQTLLLGRRQNRAGSPPPRGRNRRPEEAGSPSTSHTMTKEESPREPGPLSGLHLI